MRSFRLHFRIAAALLGLGVVAALLDARGAEPVGPPLPDAAPFDDPFPIRRVLLPRDRVAAELDRAGTGALVRMTRAEFERRVRQAAAGSRRPLAVPRLIEAHYRAKLLGDGLDENSLAGAAEWKILHDGPRPGLLPLNSLQIALRQARWTDNRAAVVGMLDPNPQSGPALLVDAAGEQALLLDWSSRGVPEQGELRFDLAVPISPIATLELEVPRGLKPYFPQDEVVLLDAPAADDSAQRPHWRVAFGGLAHLEILLRPARAADQAAALIQATASTRQDLSPGLLLNQSTFEFKALRGDVTELLVEYGPELNVTDVSIINLESWQILDGRFGGKKRIAVRLREPARGGQLRVTATAALPLNEKTAWTSPGLAIVGAVPRGEVLRLHLSPDLRLHEWSSKSFRLVRSEFAADRSQTLTLEPGFAPDAGPAVGRPTASFLSPAVEFRVQQDIDWDIGAKRSTLTSRLKLETTRGTLGQVAVRLPPGWDVDRVEAGARDSRPIWTQTAGPSPTLQIELQRPLPPGAAAELVIRLSQITTGFDRNGRRTTPFPDLIPIGARPRQGEYVVHVSQAFQASAPAPLEESDFVGPRLPPPLGKGTIWTYRFYGQPPFGPLALQARAPRLAATIDSTVSLAVGHPVVSVRLSLKPEAAAVSSVILTTSAAVALPWTWRTFQGNNQVLAVQPLPVGPSLALLGARSPLAVAAILHDRPRYRWWQMSFVRPLDAPLVLESVLAPAPEAPPADEQALRVLSVLGARPPLGAIATWAANVLTPKRAPDFPYVPLLQVVGAAAQTGTVAVQAPADAGWALETKGLIRELAPPTGGAPHETYRYDGQSLSLRGLGTQRLDDAGLRIDGAELIVAADPLGRQRCLYRFRVKNGGKPVLPIRLPAEAQIHAVAVAGQSLPAEACRIVSEAGHTVCSVPIPSSLAWQRIDVLYSIAVPSWTLTGKLNPLVPLLPAAPADTRICWRLPPGVVPAATDGLLPLPSGPARDWPLSSPWLADLSGDWAGQSPRRPAAEAAGKPASGAKGPATVRNVRQLLSGAGSLAEKPLLDALALAEADVRPATPAPDADLRSFGLVFVPFAGGHVLTTPRQASLWRGDGSSDAVPPNVRASIEQAAQYGRDASGRFRTVDDWLEAPGVFQDSLLAQLGGDGPGWTAWEVHGPKAAAPLAVVRTGEVALAGWLIAAVLAAAGFLVVGRLGRGGVVLLLAWLLAAGGALLVLPAAWNGLAVGPFLAALLVAIVSAWIRRPVVKAPPTVIARLSARGRLLTSGTTTAGLLLFFGIPSAAEAPGHAVVYLLPGTDADPDPKAVLLTPELRDRLALLAQPRLALNEAAFVRARYSGRGEASGAAEFEAQFHVVSFVEQTTLLLPLGEVRLREALLDGTAAFPKPADNDRVAVEVKGKGEHRIDLKFTVAAGGTGPDREVRFAAPELAICGLDFTAPPGAEQVRAVNWRGAQVLDDDGTLHADLGRARSVQVRWRQPGGTGTAVVRVHEASVWDIDAAATTLFASFDYRITQGSVTALKVILPPNLEVSRLEVRPETIPLGAPPTWVRDWSIGPNRVLTVELQGALTGSARLLLQGAPIRPLTARPVLQTPVAAGGAETEVAYGAYRLHGLETVAEVDRKGLVELTSELFMKDVWRNSGAEKAPAPVTRAFRRGKGDSVQLRPILRPAPAAARADQELIWWLEMRTAHVQGTAHWSAATAPLTFVEWEVPAAVVVHDVRGLGLQSWLRSGNRVIAWLREPTADATVVWHGSLARGPMSFNAPSIKLDGAAAATTVLRLRVPEGWVIAAENAAMLGKTVRPLADRELAVELARVGAPARFQIRGPQADAAFRQFAVAQVADRRLQLAVSIEPLWRRERPHCFAVAVRDAAGWAIDWRLPPGCRATPRIAAANAREWIVDVPRDSDTQSLGLHFQRPLDTRQELTLPEIDIRLTAPAPLVERRLLLIGPELRPGEMIGVSRDPERPDVALSDRPVERDLWRKRGGSLWRANGNDVRALVWAVGGAGAVATRWRAGDNDVRARLSVSPVPLAAAPAVRVALADLETAALADRWIYRATFDLQHESGASLRCALPPGATLEGWAFDGNVLPPARGVHGFSVPLPAGRGARLLQLVWSAAAMQWEAPRLEHAGQPFSPATVLWSAAPRADARLEAAASFSPAQLDLRRADALLKLAVESNAAGMSDVNVSRLAARAARWLRLADANLSGPSSDSRNDERGPGGVSLAEWLARMRDQAAALRLPRARETPSGTALSLRDATFEQLPFADAFHQGVPIHWAGPATEVRLHPVQSWSPLPALAGFSLLALAAVVLGLLMLVAGRATRPEQVAVIGLFGYIVFGAPQGYAFIPLCLFALLVRLGWLGSRFVRWLGG